MIVPRSGPVTQEVSLAVTAGREVFAAICIRDKPHELGFDGGGVDDDG